MSVPLSDAPLCIFTLQQDWAERPHFRSAWDFTLGHFQGRDHQVEQLRKFFTSGGGGTMLVSGHRGVGKTATVDQALIKTVEAIRDENFGPAEPKGSSDPLYVQDRATLRTNLLRLTQSDLKGTDPSRSRLKELVVLKLDFGQIAVIKATAVRAATPQPAADNRATGRASPKASTSPARPASKTIEVDPRQVLIEIIKGLDQHLVRDRLPTQEERSAVRQWHEVRARYNAAHHLRWPGTFKLYDRSRLYKVRAFFESRSQAFESALSALISDAMVRANYQTYRQEFARGLSNEREQQQILKTGLDLKQPVGALAAGLVGSMALALPTVQSWLAGLWFLEPFAGVAPWLSSAAMWLGGIIALFTLAIGWSAQRAFREKLSEGVKLSYTRDGSVASLKRDLEEIMSMASATSAPRDLRIVVVLDELDKIEENDMLDNVIQLFKNLFTLNRCAFVFITDKKYYDHISEEQIASAKIQTYSAQHTFFTQKTFLPRTELADVLRYMDSIRMQSSLPQWSTSSRPQWTDPDAVDAQPARLDAASVDWSEAVRFLAFESRSHFFDLVGLLNDHVDSSVPRQPQLKLTRDKVSLFEVRRKARFQRMVELVYGQERYPGHMRDHLNNALLAELYSVFDTLHAPSFTEPPIRSKAESAQVDKNEVTEAKARCESARRTLIRLLEICGALAEKPTTGQGDARKNGHVEGAKNGRRTATISQRRTLTWTGRMCDQPKLSMVSLDDRRTFLVRALEDQLTVWKRFEQALPEKPAVPQP